MKRSSGAALAFSVGAGALAACGGGDSSVAPGPANPGNGQFAQLRVIDAAQNAFYGSCITPPSLISFTVDGIGFGATPDYGTVSTASHTIVVRCDGSQQIGLAVHTPQLVAGMKYTLVLAGSAAIAPYDRQPPPAPGQSISAGTLQIDFFADPPATGPAIRFYHVSPFARTTVDFGRYVAGGTSTRLGSATFLAGTAVAPYLVPPTASAGATEIPLPDQPVPMLTPNQTSETVVRAPAAAAASPGLVVYAGIGAAAFAVPAFSPSASPSPSPSPTTGITGPTPLPLPSAVPTAVATPPPGAPLAVVVADANDQLSLLPFGALQTFSVFLVDPYSPLDGVPAGYSQLSGVVQ